jgi:hypothetical protein
VKLRTARFEPVEGRAEYSWFDKLVTSGIDVLHVGIRLAGLVVASAAIACGGSGSGSTTPPSTTPPSSTGACSVPLTTEAIIPRAIERTKSASASDRQTRRGRVYQELWKHEAAARSGRLAPQVIRPAAVIDDVGQIAVVRDQGDIVLPANPYDLRSIAVTFVRTGTGTYDLQRSTRTFQSSVGDKIPLGDDDSASVTLPFTVPFYSGRYTNLFVNSDGNVTFVNDDHASTDRDVARFLTGPPRVALLFDDLDPSSGGGVYRRIDSDAVYVTWCNVPEFGSSANTVNVQMRIGADGTIDFIYAATVNATAAVVGVSPGSTGIFTPVDVSAASTTPISGGSGGVGERFAAQQELDFVALAKSFYRTHADDFDQLVVFTNARTTERGVFSFEFTVHNEVTGIGVDIFDSSRDFGSAGRLRSIVNMDALFKFPDDPRQRFLGENNTLSVIGQEAGHRWLAYMEFRDGARNSSELLGRDEAHWSFFFDSDASNMEGNDIADLGNGQFRTVGAVSQYSALDQYAMGLRLPSEVPPMFFVRGANGDAADAPRIGVDIRGTRVDVRIEDIITAMGARRPDATTAQKAFREAFLYVVQTQTRETSEELAKLENIRSGWEAYFGASTGGRGTMNARLR